MKLVPSERRPFRRSRARVLGALPYLALGLALVDCRTPPPIARTPADPPGAAALVPDEEPPGDAARPGLEPTEHPEREAPDRDYTSEELALEERFHHQRSLSVLRGQASYYGAAFAGRKTASGEIFEPARFTAAHRTLPFGTVLRVTRLDNGAVVYVRVNDRGPYAHGRILDLSTAAARKLGMLSRGVAEVRAEIVERGKPPPPRRKKSRSRHRHPRR